MNKFHFYNSLCRILTSIYQWTFTADPKWQAFLCINGPLEMDHWFPGPRCLSLDHWYTKHLGLAKVLEVNGKAIAFDSSLRKQSDFSVLYFQSSWRQPQCVLLGSSCTFLIKRSSWHLVGGEIFLVFTWSLKVAGKERIQSSDLTGARIQSR